MRKFQKEKNNYNNNTGLFWELENRIMGDKKRIMCWGLITSTEGDPRSCSSHCSHVIAHTYAACTLTVYIGNFLMFYLGVILVSRC